MRQRRGTMRLSPRKASEATKTVVSSTSTFDTGYGTKVLSSPPLSNICHPTQITLPKLQKYVQDPLQAPRSTMCKGHRHEHAACGHLHWFEPVQKCKHFSQSRDACFGQVTTLSKVKTRIPTRCDHYFDRTLTDIERNCNGCIAAVMRQVN